LVVEKIHNVNIKIVSNINKIAKPSIPKIQLKPNQLFVVGVKDIKY
jgi:hypothetical protein